MRREAGLGYGIMALLETEDLAHAAELVVEGATIVGEDDDWGTGVLALIEANVAGYTAGVDDAIEAAKRAVRLARTVTGPLASGHGAQCARDLEPHARRVFGSR